MSHLSKEEIDFIKNHPQLSVKEIADKMGHDKNTITKYKKKFGIAFSQTHDFSEYNDYIIKSYNKKTAAELSQEIGCSKSYVAKVWMENGLKGKSCYRYYCDYDFFEKINNANQAYLIGLLASDGNLYKRENHQGQIQISLQKKDEELLLKILKVLNSNHPIKKCQNMATITIVSDKMFNDLLKIGLGEQKTWHLKIDEILCNIPTFLWKDFFRGYFDGDGCVTGKDRPSSFNVSFSLPENISQSFLKALKNCTNEDFPYIKDNRTEYYKFPFGTVQAKNSAQKYILLKLMYSHTPELFLSRKKEKADELIKMIEENVTNRSENKTAVVKWGELLENLK